MLTLSYQARALHFIENPAVWWVLCRRGHLYLKFVLTPENVLITNAFVLIHASTLREHFYVFLTKAAEDNRFSK